MTGSTFVEKHFFLAVHLVDRCLEVRPQLVGSVPHYQGQLQLFGASALVIASKFEDIRPPAFSHLVSASDGGFTKNALIVMEIELLAAIGYYLHEPTAEHHLHAFLSASETVDKPCAVLVQYIADLALTSPNFSRWSPSLHAVAAMLLACRIQKQSVPHRLTEIVEFDSNDDRSNELEEIMGDMFLLLRSAQHELSGPRVAIHRRYADENFQKISIHADSLVAVVRDLHSL